MLIHRGEIVGDIVKRSGYTLNKLAEKLGITRGTLYRKFKTAYLNLKFIVEVGNTLHYDFKDHFPAIEVYFSERTISDTNRASKVDIKYAILLEKYVRLLEKLSAIASEYDLHFLKRDMQKLLEEEEKGNLI